MASAPDGPVGGRPAIEEHEAALRVRDKATHRPKSLCQNPSLLERDDCAGKVEHGFVVDRLLFPSDQDSPESIEPRVAPLDHPPTSTEARIRLPLADLVAARFDMQRVTETLGEGARSCGVVALVSAEVLAATASLRSRPSDREALQRRLDQTHVMRVCSRHRQRQRNASSIRKKGTLCAGFASIRGIWTGFFPRRAEPSSSLRRGSASPNRCPSTRRTLEALPSRVGRTRPALSSP